MIYFAERYLFLDWCYSVKVRSEEIDCRYTVHDHREGIPDIYSQEHITFSYPLVPNSDLAELLLYSMRKGTPDNFAAKVIILCGVLTYWCKFIQYSLLYVLHRYTLHGVKKSVVYLLGVKIHMLWTTAHCFYAWHVWTLHGVESSVVNLLRVNTNLL